MLTVDLDRFPVGPGDRVLDMGCGGGRHAFALYRRGADVVEQLLVGAADLVHVPGVREVHPGTDDVLASQARLLERVEGGPEGGPEGEERGQQEGPGLWPGLGRRILIPFLVLGRVGLRGRSRRKEEGEEDLST